MLRAMATNDRSKGEEEDLGRAVTFDSNRTYGDTNMSASTCVGSTGETLDLYDMEGKQQIEERHSSSNYAETMDIKLDSKGLPLVPQPSQWKDDPLVSLYEIPLAISLLY